jgi:hypothetical protein
MRTSKPTDEERQSSQLCIWISGTITVYPRHGAPRTVSIPCTLETQLLFQRLQQEQASAGQAR